jgi:DNA repair ATPase RecN
MVVKPDINSLQDLNDAKLAMANHHLIQVESIHKSMSTTVNTLYNRLKTAKTRTSLAREALKASISAEADCEADYHRARSLLDDAYEASLVAEEDLWDMQDELDM